MKIPVTINLVTPYGHFYEIDGTSYFMYGTPREAQLLSSFVREIRRENCIIVEIGTGNGGSANILAKSLSQTGIVYTIDRDISSRRHLDNHIRFINKDSITAAKEFEDNSIDLIYVDASHTYDNVVADLTTWFPKVRKDGIFCGHDCAGHFGRFTNAQQTQLRKYQNEEVWAVPNPWEWDLIKDKWGDPFTLHPGVICAVFDFFQGDFTLYSGESSIWRAL